MTRIAGFLAATLAAALTGGLCLLIGWRIGRDSRTPTYPDTYPPEGDDGIDPPDPRLHRMSPGELEAKVAALADALVREPWAINQADTLYTCGLCGARYTQAQSGLCPHRFWVVA